MRALQGGEADPVMAMYGLPNTIRRPSANIVRRARAHAPPRASRPGVILSGNKSEKWWAEALLHPKTQKAGHPPFKEVNLTPFPRSSYCARRLMTFKKL